MALKSLFNGGFAGLIGALSAIYIVAPGVEDFKKSYNAAYQAAIDKPWSKSFPRHDGPGTLTVYAYPATGMTFDVYRNGEGKIDRDGEPALQVYANNNQTLIGLGWYKDGQLDRKDGPALISLDASGKLTCAQWYVGGKLVDPLQRASFSDAPVPVCENPRIAGPAPQPS